MFTASIASLSSESIKNVVVEQGDQEVDFDDNPVLKVLGKDQYNCVRSFGDSDSKLVELLRFSLHSAVVKHCTKAGFNVSLDLS